MCNNLEENKNRKEVVQCQVSSKYMIFYNEFMATLQACILILQTCGGHRYENMYVINFIRGFCMAMADSVPGVSGGTVAFVLGFYDKFITSLDHLFSGTKEQRKEALFFLLKLGAGWVIGFLSMVLLLANIFEVRIYEISSLFIGFIVFAIPIVVLEEKQSLKNHYISALYSIIGIVVVAAITYFNPASGSGGNVSLDQLNIGLIAYVFIAAMIAICAMVLPGISGSTLLLIFGLYVPIIEAIKKVMSLEFQYIPILGVFCLGVLTGIIMIIRSIRIALEKFRPQMMYLILGLMIGSLYPVVMGPTTLDTPKAAMTMETFSIPFFVIGGVIILGLQFLKNVLEKK